MEMRARTYRDCGAQRGAPASRFWRLGVLSRMPLRRRALYRRLASVQRGGPERAAGGGRITCRSHGGAAPRRAAPQGSERSDGGRGRTPDVSRRVFEPETGRRAEKMAEEGGWRRERADIRDITHRAHKQPSIRPLTSGNQSYSPSPKGGGGGIVLKSKPGRLGRLAPARCSRRAGHRCRRRQDRAVAG